MADLYPGVLHYIEEVVLRPTPEERSLEPALADRIIHLLGANSLPTLLNLILSSPTFRFLPFGAGILNSNTSVADPDPIRDPSLFDPRIRDPGWVKSQDPDPGSGMNNPDHGIF